MDEYELLNGTKSYQSYKIGVHLQTDTAIIFAVNYVNYYCCCWKYKRGKKMKISRKNQNILIYTGFKNRLSKKNTNKKNNSYNLTNESA